jgi:hypothetical protein
MSDKSIARDCGHDVRASPARDPAVAIPDPEPGPFRRRRRLAPRASASPTPPSRSPKARSSFARQAIEKVSDLKKSRYLSHAVTSRNAVFLLVRPPAAPERMRFRFDPLARPLARRHAPPSIDPYGGGPRARRESGHRGACDDAQLQDGPPAVVRGHVRARARGDAGRADDRTVGGRGAPVASDGLLSSE